MKWLLIGQRKTIRNYTNFLIDDEEYAKAIFAIERGNAKPRKDISALDRR